MWIMILILDGNSEIVAHVYSKIGNLICLRHLFRVAIIIFKKRPILLHTCATCYELPSKISTIVWNIVVLYRMSNSLVQIHYVTILHNHNSRNMWFTLLTLCICILIGRPCTCIQMWASVTGLWVRILMFYSNPDPYSECGLIRICILTMQIQNYFKIELFLLYLLTKVIMNEVLISHLDSF